MREKNSNGSNGPKNGFIMYDRIFFFSQIESTDSRFQQNYDRIYERIVIINVIKLQFYFRDYAVIK